MAYKVRLEKIKVIVVGATGLVGREMLKILSEIGFPNKNVYAAASAKSKGQQVDCGNNKIIVQDLAEVDFRNYDVALFSAGSAVSKIYVPKAIDSGCYAIDNTSFFRMFHDVPLIVPEINANSIKSSKLISNPNCSTIQTVLPLKPLHDLYGLNSLVISTYQSAGGAGKSGIDELLLQSKNICDKKEVIPVQKFQKQLSFNVIPVIGNITSSGYTEEEMKMINETKKILSLPNIRVTATCVRVPVIIGHAVSVTAFFDTEVDIASAQSAIKQFPGITIADDLISPIDIAGKNEVYVSRLRKLPDNDTGLTFWCVSDNVRKGAALNAVQILQKLCS